MSRRGRTSGWLVTNARGFMTISSVADKTAATECNSDQNAMGRINRSTFKDCNYLRPKMANLWMTR